MHLRYKGLVMSGDFGPLIITDLSSTVIERRSEYTGRLNDHGANASSEWLDARTWDWSLATNLHSVEEVLDMAAEAEARWTDRADMASTSLFPLEYSHDGGQTWYQVLGRPGRLTPPTPGRETSKGIGYMGLEFHQLDPRHFSSIQKRAEVTAVPASIGGLTSPLVGPLVTVASGLERAGRVTNSGDMPAPMSVTFHGPCTNPRLTSVSGVEVGYRGTLAYDEHVVIDPLAKSVKLNSRTDVPGRLTFATRLPKVAIAPGTEDWFFKATDPTGTAKAVMAWRDAFNSMQH